MGPRYANPIDPMPNIMTSDVVPDRREIYELKCFASIVNPEIVVSSGQLVLGAVRGSQRRALAALWGARARYRSVGRALARLAHLGV